MADCWSCGAEVGEDISCPTCGALQPLGDRDHFVLLGLPRRLEQARGDIDRAFREISKKVHPDRFGRESSAIERRLAVEHTARVNEAYRALKDPQSRAEYLLSLEGITVGGELARTKDAAFLVDMMEHQEAVDDATTTDALEAQREGIVTRKRALMDTLGRYFDHGDGQQAAAAGALDELRYLRRLLDRIDAKLEEMI